MNHSDAEYHVQPLPGIGEPPAGSGNIDGPADGEDATRRRGQRRNVLTGAVFGAFVGGLMGAVVGCACCWLTGQFDFLWRGLWVGVLAGPIAGLLIGFLERKVRGELVRPDVATFVCVVFALLPAVLIGLQGMSFVRGRFSGYFFLGTMFAGPMFGLLIGGILDRAFEEYGKGSRGTALAFAFAGVAVCLGIVWVIDSLAYGPDPKEVANRVRGVMTSEWDRGRKGRPARVEKVTLSRRGRTAYTGFADAMIDGRRVRLNVEVAIEDEVIEVRWSGEPPAEGRP